MSKRSESAAIPGGTRGPHDDFYCHKYQVWYQVDDCVFRGRNQTYPGCVDCFQGHLNIKCVERGVQPPPYLGADTPAQPEGSTPGLLLEMRRTR
ncbi:MAG TPA: hypothetical protein VGK94_05635 [Candidatus Polarisedimenticolia bacterium]|jgi:hypothetical protein